MVELYCELLLARANVLDQIAFGEKGARARSRGKEALKRANMSGAGAKAVGKGADGGGVGSWFGRKSEASGRPQDEGKEDEGGKEEDYIEEGLDEAAVAIFYAWSRFPHDVRELTILRGLLADRWGKDFMTLAQDNKAEVPAPERLVKGLKVRTPSQELVDSYLREIAKAYGVSWPPGGGEDDLGGAPGQFDTGSTTKGEDGGGDGGDISEQPTIPPSTPQKSSQPRRSSDADELNRFTPPRGLHSGKSPVSVAPPGPRSDNPNPTVKLPGSNSEQAQPQSGDEVAPPGPGKSPSRAGNIPELDELTRRFAALKR